MSSRKGNFLKAVDVLDMIDDALAEEYNSHDAKVSLAATKYAFLKYKMGGNIIFDPHESVKMTGNSGPYLLYSCVRAKKILDKASREFNTSAQGVFRSAAARGLAPSARGDGPDGRDPGAEVLNSPERNLIKKLLEYRAVLDEAVTEMAPHKVANYLYELAQTFSRFYENCEVIGSDQEAARLHLVQTYLATMTHGLNLLGIKIPESM
jgi:arginyl-tRNA synthetase